MGTARMLRTASAEDLGLNSHSPTEHIHTFFIQTLLPFKFGSVEEQAEMKISPPFPLSPQQISGSHSKAWEDLK